MCGGIVVVNAMECTCQDSTELCCRRLAYVPFCLPYLRDGGGQTEVDELGKRANVCFLFFLSCLVGLTDKKTS